MRFRSLLICALTALLAACVGSLAGPVQPAGAIKGASPAAWPGVPGYSYPAGQTDQLGVPGHEAGGIVTPEGAVFTPSVEVTPWLAGPRPGITARRGLPDPRVPLQATARDARGATAAWWASEVAGVASAVIALQPGRGRDAGVALRWGGSGLGDDAPPRYRFARPHVPEQPGLYSQPGEPFAPGTCWQVVPAGVGAVAVQRGTSVVAIISGLQRTSRRGLPGAKAHACAKSPATWAAIVRGRPRPGERIHVTVPLQPLPAGDPRVAQIAAADVRASGRAHVAAWRAHRERAAAVRLPEPALQKAYEASIVAMLVPRYRADDGSWVQTVNTAQYHAFWIRDAVAISGALLHAGFVTEVNENLGFLGRWQLPDGRFSSRPGQGDGHGQALWLLGQHARLTGDAAVAKRWLPEVARALHWTQHALDASPVGLLPPSDPGDNELAAGTLAGDQFWGVAGLDGAATLATVAGDAELAERAKQLRERLRANVIAAASASATPAGIAPVLDAPGGHRWGELWAAWPYPVLAPTDPLVRATMASAWRAQREGVATWNGYLHLYTGIRTWQTLLRAGEQRRPLKGLFATLAHLSATGTGFETSIRPYGNRRADINLAPHGWLAAELVTFVRDLLVREQDEGLVLLGAVPDAWLRAGRTTQAARLPTAFGDVALRLTARRGGATLTWSLTPRPVAALPARVTMPLPPGVRAASLTGDGTLVGRTVTLSGQSGTVRLRWHGRTAGGPSLQATIAQLQREYARRGKTPPR